MLNDVILEVRDLKTYFPMGGSFGQAPRSWVKAVDGVSFSLRAGETLGLVGESGCGKSTVGRSLLRLTEPTSGEIRFRGVDLRQLSRRALRKLRREMAMIFQDPYGSLNPRHSARRIIAEPLRIHRLVRSENELHEKVDELMRRVGLDPTMGERAPHEFSGGQRQRIGIARALASSPSLIVCDEAISALDVSIQAQIINLLQDLQREETGLSYVFIAHDLSVVRHISDRIAVMYLGHIVEISDVHDLYDQPQHPYTRALLSAVPIPDPSIEAQREIILLEGEIPSPVAPPSGCPFRTRCGIAKAHCADTRPQLRTVRPGHQVACHEA